MLKYGYPKSIYNGNFQYKFLLNLYWLIKVLIIYKI